MRVERSVILSSEHYPKEHTFRPTQTFVQCVIALIILPENGSVCYSGLGIQVTRYNINQVIAKERTSHC